MAQIIWDSNTIDLLVGENSLTRICQAKFNQNRSGSGQIETINEYQIEVYRFDAVYFAEQWRQLYSWFYGWAALGQTWSFTMDTSRTKNKSLDDAAAAGQKVIPLVGTNGIRAGDEMILTPAARTHREAIKVAKITDGISITAVDNLFYTYASGDKCRHSEYFPYCTNTMENWEYTQDGDYFFSTFEFIEVVS